jgi:hypothetical protein
MQPPDEPRQGRHSGEQAEELGDSARSEAPVAEGGRRLGQSDDVARDAQRCRSLDQRALAEGEQLEVKGRRVAPERPQDVEQATLGAAELTYRTQVEDLQARRS